MNTEQLKRLMPAYAKDISLNLSSVLAVDDTTQLTQTQIYGLALTCALTTKNENLVEVINEIIHETQALTEAEISAVHAAVTIMAMNNIYYRFVHMVEDQRYVQLPARLRMNVIANPGIEKTDFEMYCLAASVLNGCSFCVKAHAQQLSKQGLDVHTIQHISRIAAVLNATAMGLLQADAVVN